MIKGLSCRVDAVLLGELSAALLGPVPTLSGQYALVDSRTGDRFGSGKVTVWGEETTRALLSLVEAMEKDLARELFGAPIDAAVPAEGSHLYEPESL